MSASIAIPIGYRQLTKDEPIHEGDKYALKVGESIQWHDTHVRSTDKHPKTPRTAGGVLGVYIRKEGR